MRLCRDYGIDEINFDLIYGLPNQTLENFAKTLEYTVLLKPSRIAVFGYAHVPWKKKNICLIDETTLPSEALRYELYSLAEQMLAAGGYVRIGIDHFAKQEDPLAKAYLEHRLKRNFQGYTVDDARVMIGLGASAIGSVEDAYFQNASGVEDYQRAVSADKLPVTRGYRLTPEDQLRKSIIEEIMCYLRIDFSHARFSEYDTSPIRESLAALQQDGLISIEGTLVAVNQQTPQAARILCSLFDSSYLPEAARHSKVV